MNSNFSSKYIIVSCLAVLTLNLASCSTAPRGPKRAKIEDLSCFHCAKRAIHIVDRGESLYSIAFGYGRDFRKLAAANHIAYPYKIYPGQKIYLNQLVSRRFYKAKKIYNDNKDLAQVQPIEPVIQEKNYAKQAVNNLVWDWPIKGKITTKFNDKNALNKGIDITVNNTRDVNAAADGVVVYHGAGLKGYGKLIIIKHSDEYLSAYAHNDVLNVVEGQKVIKGQKIAKVGEKTRNLHFEIRKDGKPVNPLAYLPS